ncbi:MAG: hypothetical protein CL918_02465 [Deltaproteobacteria bacterium]|nr:hypothetical protein [Deltaproteobacteria bacterium]RZO43482.1 MAG: DUF350 domain-containing protein [Pseudomonadota bacterium]|tara:strand:- start:2602 stop:3078 length:477 start_codon:yes stop_codon:yes gene_type:complete
MVISHFVNVSLEILIYFLVSIICLFIGRKVLDLITPYDLDKQTSEEKNIAAGITESGFYISMAIIVHASVTGVVNYEMFSFINQEDPQRFALLGAELITTAVYLLIGLICLSLGRRTLDWITKFDLNKEIQLERNVGVGAIEASMYISIAIIIHGIMV